MTAMHTLRVGSLAVALAWACGGRQSDASASRTASSTSNPAATPVVDPPHGITDSMLARADSARILGSTDARVWLIMSSDFQCPYCRNWHEESFGVIRDQYVRTGKVRLAYLNFPLQRHPNAWPAAEAAMCAAIQGRFWEMHDSLFSTQGAWGERPDATPYFDTLAVRLALNVPAFRSCETSHETRPLIQADQERSEAAGVNSTPTFFIGTTKIEGAFPLAVFRHALDSALAAQPAAPGRR
jgi:protein-disulfide isomerase